MIERFLMIVMCSAEQCIRREVAANLHIPIKIASLTASDYR